MITDDQSILLAAEKSQCEVDMLATVLCDPTHGMPIAGAAGINPGCFTHHDLRLIWCAADLMRNASLVEVLELARRALECEQYWALGGPISSTGCRWSNETLADMAGRWFHTRFAIERAAKNLLDVNARIAECENLQQRINELVSHEADPKPANGNSSMRIVMRPPTRRMKGVA